MKENQTATFAPQLIIPGGVKDISFYTEGFGAVELRRFSNEDGTIHVAELSIEGSLFHLHEEVLRLGSISPERYPGTTTTIGLFVNDVDLVMNRAIAAGAKSVSNAQDYDYGYRQGEIRDLFGHLWLIEKKL